MRAVGEGLRGSFPPLVTPFRDGAVDFEAFAALVEQHAQASSPGIVVNGTTAEPSTLTVEERKRLAETAVEAAASRLQIIIATGSQSYAETVELSEHAGRTGADALLVVTPYYIKPPADGIVTYFSEICSRVERPVLLYHIPGRAGVEVTIEALERIAASVANFVGIKHASPDLSLVSDIRARLGEEFRILVGLEELSLPMLALGADGMVNAVGNLAPGSVQGLYESVADDDLAEARRRHYDLLELNRAIFWETNPIPLKYLLARLGAIPSNEHRLPMRPAPAHLARRLDDLLDRIDAEVLK